MDIKKIKQLADLMKAENLKTLEIVDKDQRICLVKHDGGVKEVRTLAGTTSLNVDVGADVGKKGAEVKSPLVGIYYASPAPDAPPYVSVGKRVKKGEVLCIIEAMKQMNEIVADADCEIVEVPLKNGEIVEYDQVIFRII